MESSTPYPLWEHQNTCPVILLKCKNVSAQKSVYANIESHCAFYFIDLMPLDPNSEEEKPAYWAMGVIAILPALLLLVAIIMVWFKRKR